jgi:ABC-type molybdenum transport system ATPase subunit/photorepair protein PhrA
VFGCGNDSSSSSFGVIGYVHVIGSVGLDSRSDRYIGVTRMAARIRARHLSSYVVRIPKANIYRFGDSDRTRPVLAGVDWTVREGESWAVVGSGAGGKTALLEVKRDIYHSSPQRSLFTRNTQTLLGNTRISPPPPGGPLPTLSLKSRPINEAVYFVSFAHRPRASGGAFYDYTARYGAVRDEDRLTLRQSMFLEESGLIRDSIKSFIVDESVTGHEREDAISRAEEKKRRFEDLTDKLGLQGLLDLPLVALSNGQTRRARIVKALLEQPDILLLDEPLSRCPVLRRATV